MPTLLEEIAKILECSAEEVRLKLTNRYDRNRVFETIRGKSLRINYLDKDKVKSIIYCDLITSLGAHQIMAFGVLRYPLNICVSAYFYARHEIKLKFPFHQCIYYKKCYYPLELLEFCSDNDEIESDSPIIMSNQRKHASSSNSLKTLETTTESTVKNEKHSGFDDNVEKGIFLLYIDDKNLWEKRDFALFPPN